MEDALTSEGGGCQREVPASLVGLLESHPEIRFPVMKRIGYRPYVQVVAVVVVGLDVDVADLTCCRRVSSRRGGTDV